MEAEEKKAAGSTVGTSPHLVPYAATVNPAGEQAQSESTPTPTAASRPIPIPAPAGERAAPYPHYTSAGPSRLAKSYTHQHHISHMHPSSSSRSVSHRRAHSLSHPHSFLPAAAAYTRTRERERSPTPSDYDSTPSDEEDAEEAITPFASPESRMEHSFGFGAGENGAPSVSYSPRRRPFVALASRVPGSATPSPYTTYTDLPTVSIHVHQKIPSRTRVDVGYVEDVDDGLEGMEVEGMEEVDVPLGNGKMRKVQGSDVRDALLLLHFKSSGSGSGKRN
jgi:hypothetical protein